MERRETWKRGFSNSSEKVVVGIVLNIRLEGRSDGKKKPPMLEVRRSDYHEEGRRQGNARKKPLVIEIG